MTIESDANHEDVPVFPPDTQTEVPKLVDKVADSGESVVATRQSAKTNEAGFGYQQVDPLSPFVLSNYVENKVAKETKVQIQEFGADLKEINQ